MDTAAISHYLDTLISLGIVSKEYAITEESFGRWWGNNSALKREEEIDIVGINPLKKQAVFAECKFRNQLVGPEIFENLRNKAALVKGFEETYYILFSKSGFSDTLTEQVPENTLLISLADIYS